MALACLAVLPLVQFLQHWTGTYVEDQARNAVLMAAGVLGRDLHHALLPDHHRLRVRRTGPRRAPGPAPARRACCCLGLALIGGGVATTAGGVKLLRVYALFRHGERELERLIHPNSVGGDGDHRAPAAAARAPMSPGSSSCSSPCRSPSSWRRLR